MEGWTDGWIDRQIGRWTDGQMDSQMDRHEWRAGWLNRSMDGKTDVGQTKAGGSQRTHLRGKILRLILYTQTNASFHKMIQRNLEQNKNEWKTIITEMEAKNKENTFKVQKFLSHQTYSLIFIYILLYFFSQNFFLFTLQKDSKYTYFPTTIKSHSNKQRCLSESPLPFSCLRILSVDHIPLVGFLFSLKRLLFLSSISNSLLFYFSLFWVHTLQLSHQNIPHEYCQGTSNTALENQPNVSYEEPQCLLKTQGRRRDDNSRDGSLSFSLAQPLLQDCVSVLE